MKLSKLLPEGSAADKAHKRGLVSVGYDKWADKSGKTVARTVDDDLKDVGEEEPIDKQATTPGTPDSTPTNKQEFPDPKPTGMSAKTAGTAPTNHPTAVDGAQKNGMSAASPKAPTGGQAPPAVAPNPYLPKRIASTIGKPLSGNIEALSQLRDQYEVCKEIIIGEEPILMDYLDEYLPFLNEPIQPKIYEAQTTSTLQDSQRQQNEWKNTLSPIEKKAFDKARDVWQHGQYKHNTNKVFNRLGNGTNKPIVHTNQHLERGMSFSIPDAKDFLKSFRIGQNVDMPPSGFSGVHSIARHFIDVETPKKISVLLRLSPNKNGEIQGMHLMRNGESHYDSEAEIIRPSGPKARCIGVSKLLSGYENDMSCTYIIDLEERMNEDDPTDVHIKEGVERQKNSLFDTAMNSSVYNPPNAYDRPERSPNSAYNRPANNRMHESFMNRQMLEEMILESKAAEDAHRLNLHSIGWSWWADDSGEVVAKTIKGVLTKIDRNNPEHMQDMPEPNDKVLTFTKNSDVPNELNGIPFTPWINVPETPREWYNVDGIDKSIDEPPWPQETKKSYAPHVETPSKLHQHENPKEPDKKQKKFSFMSMLSGDDDKHSFKDFNKRQQNLQGQPKSDKTYWDANTKSYQPSAPLPMRKAAGCIIQESDGRVWIVEPFNHFAEYQHTFPKGGIEDQLTAQETAIKEAYEETGLKVRIKKYIGDYKSDTGTTMTRYYLAEREAGSPTEHGWETNSVKLVPIRDLKNFFNQKRDQNIAMDIDTPYKNENLNESIMLMESVASDQAHALNLTHHHYGYWMDSTGKIVARTVNGVLTRFKGELPKHYTNQQASGNSGENLFNYKKGNGFVPQHVQKAKEKTKKKELDKPNKLDLPLPGNPDGWLHYSNPKIKTLTDVNSDTNILFHQDQGSTGSNPGGFYTGKDGIKRYVKFYNEDGQAQGEDLANKIFTIMGIAAPKSQTFMHDGKVAFASDVVEGKELQHVPITPELAQKILDGFVGDVLVANADALGAQKGQSYHRNCLVSPNGDPVRIDQGGALLFRGLSGRKPPEWLPELREWDGFQSSKNPGYKMIFDTAGLSLKDMKGMMAEKLTSFFKVVMNDHGSMNQFVQNMAPNMSVDDREEVTNMLSMRMQKIFKKLGQL